MNRIRPFWPRVLTPTSVCPHGVRIDRDRICGICHDTAKITQREIDETSPPPPLNPEDRALAEIAFLKLWLKDHPESDTQAKVRIFRRIRRCEYVVNEWIQPTKYRPDPKLKGGK